MAEVVKNGSMADVEGTERAKCQKGTGAQLSELERVEGVPPDNPVAGIFPMKEDFR